MNSQDGRTSILIQPTPLKLITKMANPESYIAYRFEEKNGNLKRTVVPWHDPKQGEVIVKVLACGVCGTYVHHAAYCYSWRRC